MSDITSTNNQPPTSTKVSSKHLRQVSNVQELLINDMAREQLGKVAAKHMNPERMMRVIANAIRTTPKLAQCDPLSLLGAMMNAAALGLEPNTPLGHAYLIPFDNKRKGVTEVQLIVGYKGFADMARRSGMVKSLHADVVYSDDEKWSYEYGSNMHLSHKPGPRNGKKTHAYCHVKLDDGEAFVVLPWAEVIRIRDQSQNWKSAVKFGKTAMNPWSTHEDRMAAKTALRALANRGEMPLSIEMLQQMEIEDTGQGQVDYASYALGGDDVGIIDGELVDEDDEGQDDADQAGEEGRGVEVEEDTKQPAKPEPTKEKPKTEGKPAKKGEPEKVEEAGQGDLLGNTDTDNSSGGDDTRRASLEKQADVIIADMLDIGPDTALETHKAVMEDLKKFAPDLHKRVLEEAEAFKS